MTYTRTVNQKCTVCKLPYTYLLIVRQKAYDTTRRCSRCGTIHYEVSFHPEGERLPKLRAPLASVKSGENHLFLLVYETTAFLETIRLKDDISLKSIMELIKKDLPQLKVARATYKKNEQWCVINLLSDQIIPQNEMLGLSIEGVYNMIYKKNTTIINPLF